MNKCLLDSCDNTVGSSYFCSQACRLEYEAGGVFPDDDYWDDEDEVESIVAAKIDK